MSETTHFLIATFPGSPWLPAAEDAANQFNRAEQERLEGQPFTSGILRALLAGPRPEKPRLLAVEASPPLFDAIIEAAPGVEVLLIAEDPRRLLSAAAREDDRAAVLHSWSAAARAANFARRNAPARVTIVSADEARESPEAFAKFLEKFHPGCRALRAPAESPDSVRHVLAHMEILRSPRVLDLVRELEASFGDFGSTASQSTGDARLPAAWNEWFAAQESAARAHTEMSKKTSEAETLRRELREVRESAKRLQTKSEETKKLESTLKESQEENELLLLQLHQVQEELEHYFLENRKLRQPASRPSGALRLTAEAVHIGAPGGEAPHLHLDFSLEGVSAGTGSFSSLSLRLVEHQGHPGLLVFADSPSGRMPLMHWRANAEEDGRPFMLIVPQDKEGRDFLTGATTSDLSFLQGAAHLLVDALAGDAAESSHSARWSAVAQAFIDRCNDAPIRLHYDDVLPEPLPESGMRFRVIRASVAGRHIPELDFMWRGASLSLRVKRGSPPPLSNWPQAKDGNNADEVVFDFGNARPGTEPWNSLSGTDRLLLLHTVSELPNFLYHLEAKHAGLKLDKHRLLQTAKAMRRRARAVLYPARARQKLARVARSLWKSR